MEGVYAEVAESDPVACIRFEQSSIYFGRLAR